LPILSVFGHAEISLRNGRSNAASRGAPLLRPKWRPWLVL